jgi:hypothetical protein
MNAKDMGTVVRAAVLGMAAVTLWGLAPGCGSSIGSYCDQVCECVGCSESERTDCADSLEDAKKAAEDDGCGGEFQDFLSCINSELECKDDQFSADGCDAEAEAFGECSPTSGIGKNACQKLVDTALAKYEACGVDPQDIGIDPDDECTEEEAAQAECFGPCFQQAPCECIDPEAPEGCTAEIIQPYIDCIQGCPQ